MMVFFDTNVLIYALCQNTDSIEQQNISVALFEKAVLNKNLILSELILCEFAFCEENDCQLITFDKGFKKLQDISKIEIEIKSTFK